MKPINIEQVPLSPTMSASLSIQVGTLRVGVQGMPMFDFLLLFRTTKLSSFNVTRRVHALLIVQLLITTPPLHETRDGGVHHATTTTTCTPLSRVS